MIYAKSLKEKRILYIALIVIEYLLLKSAIHFNVWFQVLYTIMTFLTLKIIYKDKANVTDIFTFAISSIILILVSLITFLLFRPDMVLGAIVNRLTIFVFLFVFRHKLPKIQKLYKKFWNRNDKIKKKMKSATFRALNAVVFNFMFFAINAGMIYMLILRR